MSPVSAGRQIGRYRILARIGEGGMGVVFRARDERLERDVAIKFLSEELNVDDRGLARFEREVRAASSINHPNIVTVHDVGRFEGRPYLVMELVFGQTLRARLAKGPFSCRDAIDLAAQIADALAAAHGAGIVHRDLKPENIMVTPDGYAKLLDFGLAKLGGAEDGGLSSNLSKAETLDGPQVDALASRPGSLIGTVGYMAPEQVRTSSVDFRADQFAFGAILYEMATGRRAFTGASRSDVLAAILTEEPVPLPVLSPQFCPPARWLVERCLEKDPDRRYASTVDLARELRTVRDHLGETTSASASGVEEPPVRLSWPARRRLQAVLAVVALVGLGTLTPTAIRRLVSSGMPEVRQLAVLPFLSTADDPRQRQLGEGLIETLSSGLTQLERFHDSLAVVPAIEVRQTAADGLDDARDVLGATLAITGSVQRSGDRLRVTANLVDTTRRLQLRSVSFDAAVSDLIEIQDGLVRRVGEMLELEIGPDEERLLAAGRTSSAPAYEAYLRGRGRLLDYASAPSLEEAVAEFQEALQRDPDYALAYAGLGEAYWRQYELERAPDLVELAKMACDRALRINELLAPVHVTLGIVRSGTGEPEAALEEFGRALRLDPGNVLALRERGRALERLERFDEAEATYRRAIDRHPRSWSGHNLLGGFLFDRGRYMEALEAFRRVTEIAPENPRGYSNLGGTLLVLGRDEEAREALERVTRIQPTAPAFSNLGTLDFGAGRFEEAAASFERAIELGSRDYRVWQNLGSASLALPGREGMAKAAFARAAELATERLEVDPGDPRVLADLAECEALLGNVASARARIEGVLAERPDDVEILRRAVTIYEKGGDRESALRRLGEAFSAGLPRREIEVDPALADLRRDARYEAMAPGATEPSVE